GEIKVELEDSDDVAAACELRAQLAGVSIASGILLRPAVIRNATTEFSRKKSEDILAKGGAAVERASAAVDRVSGLDKTNETAQKVRKAAAVAHHALEHVKEEVEIVAKKVNEIIELTAGATEHAKGAKANGDASAVKVSNLLARAKESENQYVKEAAEECSESTNYDVTAKSLAAALDKLPGVKEDNAVKTTFQSILTSLDNLDKDVKSVEQRAEELETALEKAERQLEKAEKAAEEAETESSKVETES
nr:Chain A, Haptoglobin-haemoglobin receptor [Trypanosoma congolense]